MAKFYTELPDNLIKFIEKQHIFFTGTAAAEGRVNVSPKGMDSLRILSPKKLVWLNLTGSGNETAAHLLAINRLTIMFCSFEKNPMILRLYGSAKMHHSKDQFFKDHVRDFEKHAGARQIVEMDIESIQTSCGYAVPFMEYKEERTVLTAWAEKKGKEGIQEYWKDRNTESIDGFRTDILR